MKKIRNNKTAKPNITILGKDCRKGKHRKEPLCKSRCWKQFRKCENVYPGFKSGFADITLWHDLSWYIKNVCSKHSNITELNLLQHNINLLRICFNYIAFKERESILHLTI